MKSIFCPLLCVLCYGIWNPADGAEPVTIGGAVVTLPAGWEQKSGNGSIFFVPSDLAAGGCTFTLAAGESFNGSTKDRLATEWKGFEALGRVVSDDGGKVEVNA